MRVFVIIAFRHLTNIEIMVIGIYCREKKWMGHIAWCIQRKHEMSSIQCLSTTAAKSTASCATFVIIGNFTSRRRFCSIYARPDRRRKQNAIINDSVTIAQRNHHAVCSLSLSLSLSQIYPIYRQFHRMMRQQWRGWRVITASSSYDHELDILSWHSATDTFYFRMTDGRSALRQGILNVANTTFRTPWLLRTVIPRTTTFYWTLHDPVPAVHLYCRHLWTSHGLWEFYTGVGTYYRL